jgi:hypothetical protein
MTGLLLLLLLLLLQQLLMLPVQHHSYAVPLHSHKAVM